MGCMVLCRTFHTAPEQEDGRTGYVPIFRSWNCCVFQLYVNGFQVSSPGPRYSQCERFLHSISLGLGPGPGHSQCDYTIRYGTVP